MEKKLIFDSVKRTVVIKDDEDFDVALRTYVSKELVIGLPHDFSIEWDTKQNMRGIQLRGKLPKRLAQYLKKQHNISLTPDTLTTIGNMYNNYVVNEKITFDLTNDLNWKPGDFGEDRNSCYWTSTSHESCYAGARHAIPYNGGGAIRFYDSNGMGKGRAWLVPVDVPNYNGEAWTVFNSYGYTNRKVAAILSNTVGFHAQEIVLYCPYTSPVDIYFNSTISYLLTPTKPTLVPNEIEISLLPDPDFEKPNYCESCGGWCYGGTSCNQHEDEEDMAECYICNYSYPAADTFCVIFSRQSDELVCAHCYDLLHKCAHCGAYSLPTNSVYLNGDTYREYSNENILCIKCANTMTTRCDKCFNLTMYWRIGGLMGFTNNHCEVCNNVAPTHKRITSRSTVYYDDPLTYQMSLMNWRI